MNRPRSAPRRVEGARDTVGALVWPVLGGLGALWYVLILLMPVLALAVYSLANGSAVGAMSSPAALQALRLSIGTSLTAMALVVVTGTPVAYLLARRRFAGKAVVDAVLDLPLVLPPVVAGLGLLVALGRNGFVGSLLYDLGVRLPFTAAAVVLAQFVVSGPYYVRAARLGFEAVDPDTEAVARTLGAGPVRVFLEVALPLAWTGILSGLALAWARALAEFGATLMFAGNFAGRTRTLPLAVMSALESDMPTAVGMSLLLTVFALAVLVILSVTGRLPWGGRR